MDRITDRMTAALRKRLTEPAPPDTIEDLARRVAHLEAALEGLQDAVYRQDVVHDRQIADLRKHRVPGSESSEPSY